MNKLILIFIVVIFLASCNTHQIEPQTEIDRNLLATEIAATIRAGVNQTSTANAPTNTPEPTNTPLPPTPTPEPIILTGTGDSIVDFYNSYEIAIVHITGNASSRHFAVKNYGSDGNSIDLLVNITGPYDGVRPLDFGDGEHTTRFEVSASGEWRIEVLPIASARVLTVPGVIEGRGDDVIFFKGATPDLAKIKGNAESRHFAVKGYGKHYDLLVNTTDPYEGTVIVSDDTVVIEIRAEGSWSIEITAK